MTYLNRRVLKFVYLIVPINTYNQIYGVTNDRKSHLIWSCSFWHYNCIMSQYLDKS